MTFSLLFSSKALQDALWLLTLMAVGLALVRPRLGGIRLRAVERSLTHLSRRPWRAFILAALFPMIIRLLLLPILPVPSPRIHDEFSYLLLGDTLAHGRFTNPTPPLWHHFETEYELMRPSYASQYQPAQGLFLAAGQLAAGIPWLGVWLSVGLMCGALYWALAGLLPAPWALFGALASALQFGIFGFWMNSYFGGSVSATAGALVFGSLTRRRYPSLCALGLIVLFASRPAEAILWTIAAIAMFPKNLWALKHLAGFALIFGSGAAGLCYYNFRVTGHPLYPPYAAYRHDYGVPQSYWWQPAVLVTDFTNPQLAANYSDQLAHWRQRDSAAALWNSTWRRIRDFWRFFIGPLLTPALLFAASLSRRRRLRPWLWISALFVLNHATYHAWYPQQSGPATVLIVLLLVECWRSLRTWRRRHETGIALSRFLMTAFALAILLIAVGMATERHLPGVVTKTWASLRPGPDPRIAVIQTLAHTPGSHLVFMHYGPTHNWYNEWVFNNADLTGSRVVFARMLDPESDLALVSAMTGRQVWIADPDEHSLQRLRRP